MFRTQEVSLNDSDAKVFFRKAVLDGVEGLISNTLISKVSIPYADRLNILYLEMKDDVPLRASKSPNAFNDDEIWNVRMFISHERTQLSDKIMRKTFAVDVDQNEFYFDNNNGARNIMYKIEFYYWIGVDVDDPDSMKACKKHAESLERKARKYGDIPNGSTEHITFLRLHKATLIPWYHYSDKDLLHKYEEPISVLYSKCIVGDGDFLVNWHFKYFILDRDEKAFGESITLVTPEMRNSYPKEDILGTIITPIPIESIDGYIGIIDNDDLKVGRLISDGTGVRFMEKLIKEYDQKALETESKIKSYIKSMSVCRDKDYEKELVEHFQKYSFVFANMLKSYFGYGYIRCFRSDMHSVWVDEYGHSYDSTGWCRDVDNLFFPKRTDMSLEDKSTFSYTEYCRISNNRAIKNLWPNS